MKARMVKVTMIALVLLAMVAAPALAVTVSGTGTLTATGRGSAWLRGNATITVSGNGALYLKDNAGDAKITVTGYEKRVTLKDGTIVYSRFRGRAEVQGSDVKVLIKGWGIHLTATGTGTAVLRGRGVYHVGDKQGVWTPGGTVIQLTN
jgi:type 1 fimbria pilin